jgi:Zn-dependent protease
MLGWQIKLGRIFGIEIDLHFSWFVIAILLTISLASYLYQVNNQWSAAMIWTAAGVAALAFFAAILLHELAHAAVARVRGVKVPSITLFALGGMAQISRDTTDARTEFWMSLAGPAMSVLIGIVALGCARLVGWNYDATPDSPVMVMLVWFGFINITLAVFNMIPGFPLNGGRVLRAIIWWWTGDQVRATRVAATLGQVVAYGFIFVGFLSFISGGGFGGLWLAFIGWFLADAARSAAFETTVTERLRGVRVRDVMSRDCATVERGTSISDVAEEVLRSHAARRATASCRSRRPYHRGAGYDRRSGRKPIARTRSRPVARGHLARSHSLSAVHTRRTRRIATGRGRADTRERRLSRPLARLRGPQPSCVVFRASW